MAIDTEPGGVGDGEVIRCVLIDRHPSSGRYAEDRPLYERFDRPRKVVVQTDHRGFGTGVREVDRTDFAVLDDRLA